MSTGKTLLESIYDRKAGRPVSAMAEKVIRGMSQCVEDGISFQETSRRVFETTGLVITHAEFLTIKVWVSSNKGRAKMGG